MTEQTKHPLAGKVVYLAGPMTGYADFNYPLFHKVAADLRDLGAVVISPAEHSIPMTSSREKFMRLGFTKLLQCTHICMLPFWGLSEGAGLEILVALACGMEVWYTELDSTPTISPTPRPAKFIKALEQDYN